jgi:hypothetical protein
MAAACERKSGTSQIGNCTADRKAARDGGSVTVAATTAAATGNGEDDKGKCGLYPEAPRQREAMTILRKHHFPQPSLDFSRICSELFAARALEVCHNGVAYPTQDDKCRAVGSESEEEAPGVMSPQQRR